MLCERVQYQGKAGFLTEFSKNTYFLKHWQVLTRQVFDQTVTYFNYVAVSWLVSVSMPYAWPSNKPIQTIH